MIFELSIVITPQVLIGEKTGHHVEHFNCKIEFSLLRAKRVLQSLRIFLVANLISLLLPV